MRIIIPTVTTGAFLGSKGRCIKRVAIKTARQFYGSDPLSRDCGVCGDKIKFVVEIIIYNKYGHL
jgi:hypothetical protein